MPTCKVFCRMDAPGSGRSREWGRCVVSGRRCTRNAALATCTGGVRVYLGGGRCRIPGCQGALYPPGGVPSLSPGVPSLFGGSHPGRHGSKMAVSGTKMAVSGTKNGPGCHNSRGVGGPGGLPEARIGRGWPLSGPKWAKTGQDRAKPGQKGPEKSRGRGSGESSPASEGVPADVPAGTLLAG